MSKFDYDKIKKNKESNYLRLVIIGGLLAVTLTGKVNIRTGDVPEDVPPITSLTIPTKQNLFKGFKTDLMNYIPKAKKTGYRETHKSTKNLASKIGQTQVKIEELKQEEEQLKILVDNVPIEIYDHNKLDLTSFMIEELKARNLIYSIKYNYDFNNPPDDEELKAKSTSKEEGEDVEVKEEVKEPLSAKITPITEAFMIRIYQIDKEDNYEKVLDILDTIYIKEPYEIIKFKMGYDEISRSYYIEYVIGV